MNRYQKKLVSFYGNVDLSPVFNGNFTNVQIVNMMRPYVTWKKSRYDRDRDDQDLRDQDWEDDLREDDLREEYKNGERTTERLKDIISLVNDRTITSVLDVGAGNAEISLAVKNHYKLKSNQVLLLDPKVVPSNRYLKIEYDDNWNFLLEDNQVDLVLLFNVLHHVEPYQRKHLISEVTRVLKPGGLVIIRDHDAINDKDYMSYLDLYHTYWYLKNDETPDPMWLFPKDSLTDVLLKYGLVNEGLIQYPNLQRLFTASYMKTY